MPSIKTPQNLAQTLAALQTAGLERLDAQLLLLHLLGQPPHQRGWLLAHDTDQMPSELATDLKLLVQRRLKGEPLAYLTGHKEFFGLDLRVDARVLVPRPDTETLVNWALEVLTNAPKALAEGHAQPTSTDKHDTLQALPLVQTGPKERPLVLDLGTGSGAIALALKSSHPDLQVHAIDFSRDALAVAQANAQRLQLDVTFSQGAWFAGLPDAAAKYDCIVSNPPYIAALDPHLAALAHEPLQALASGADGLEDIRQIITHAAKYLNPQGWLLVEHGYDQALAARDLLTTAGFTQVQSRCDLASIERCSGGQFQSTPDVPATPAISGHENPAKTTPP